MSRLPGLLALGLLAATAVVTIRRLRPPPPLPADAASREFSAARANEHVRRFARRPHPVGSAEHARVRDYLVSEMRRLGLRTEVQEAVGRSPRDRRPVLGRVFNIVGVVPGAAPTGRVIVTAHYDSVPSGPGASDDGTGVAALLETARALTSDPTPPRNDVVFVATDAEEAGLLGAAAFTDEHPLAQGPAIVLNWDARGNRGPVLMFRTSQPNARLVRTFARSAPYPVADSGIADIAARVPNDTDLSAFLAAGLAGLDSGYITGAPYFHSPLDDPGHVDEPTLQQLGSNMLALTRAFGESDLSEPDDAERLVYFNTPSGALAHYPARAAIPLAALGLAATTALVVAGHRRGVVRFSGFLAGTASALLPLGLSVAAGQALWPMLVRVRPEYATMRMSTTYRPGHFEAGLLALVGGIVLGWYGVARRRWGPEAPAVGMLVWPTTLGSALAVLSPGSSHLAALPALGAATGRLATMFCPPRWHVPVTAASLVPAAVIGAGTWELLPLGLRMAGITAAPRLAFSAGLALPLIEELWPRRWAYLPPVLAFGIAAALVARGLVTDRVSPDQPGATTLRYIMDADTRQAMWGADPPLDAWNAGYVHTDQTEHPFIDVWGAQPICVGPAKASDVPAPALTILDDTTEGSTRRLRVLLRSQRDVSSIALSVMNGEIREIVVAGRQIVGSGFTFVAPDPDGTEVTLSLTKSDEPVRLRVSDTQAGPGTLTDLPGYAAPPDWLYLLRADVTVVRTYEV
ncbi:peptidase M28-like protein [Nonomuraea polychroma]|uniref:Peptidase M28-like protein n=1 Tax=Nonomuraea polychroma TaxID=46176 RepID=A0A438M205_9ACTN|nr:M20/M25/M40 family metallo-hydrolase [Nonomuraea polychroma]RVX39782.1 peptidase M28-like protein [Nonomuraea polychroma]